VPRERFEEAMEPRHVAISLDGEPSLYPYLPELIEEFHDRDITTFLVSNGTRPEVLAECDPTQLYVSVDAPDRKTFDSTVKAVEGGAWDSLIDTLDVLAEKDETRTVIRTTLVNGENMHHPAWYAAMCDRANVDYVELKAYMHVGHSRGRLDRDSMPAHDDVVEFTKQVGEWLPDHDTIKEVPESHVALLAREEETWVPKLEKSSEFWERDPVVSY
jgi:tRNA wybutosine-synthesizing protein 1